MNDDLIIQKAITLTGKIDRQCAWRKKEITEIFSVILKEGHCVYIQNKMLHCLLYSHWEGLVREIMTLFFEFLRERKLKFNQLKQNFHISAALTQLYSHKSSDALDVNYIKNYYNNSIDLNVDFDFPTGFCTTKSNLNSKNFEQICFKLGIPVKNEFKTKFHFIDETLVGTRNAIAHGEHRQIESKDLNETKIICIQLMDAFCDEIKSMIESFEFLQGV